MSPKNILGFVFLMIALYPASVFALSFSCCECESISLKQNVCVLIPDIKDCNFAASEINNNTDDEFKLTCKSLNSSACTKISENSSAICSNAPQAYDKVDKKYLLGSGEDDAVYATATQFSLGVDIPGVEFPEKLEVVDSMIHIPYLAIYLSGLHKYLIGIGLIAAALIIIYGGILYIIASTGAKVSDAKEKIKDGLLGLSILLGSVAILGMINPNTTEFGSMKVKVVGPVDTPQDPDAARALVLEAAKIRWSHNLPGVDELDFEEGPVSKIYIPDEGSIATNVEGLPVAQGDCPPDMIAIRQSDAYQSKIKKDISSFCIDRYEAPNRRGIKPFSGVLGIEAAWWCDRRGKRLCTMDEWQRACLGPEGKNTYGYGEQYIPGEYVNKGAAIYPTDNNRAPCNYDSYNPDAAKLIGLRDKILGAFNKFYPVVPDGSILVPERENTALLNEEYREAYYNAKQYLEEINSKVEISGRRPTCVTEEGAVDMVGNVQEIALRKKMTLSELESLGPTALNKESYAWMNFYWSPIAHLANLQAKPTCNQVWGGDHAISWRSFETGFRCCMDLADKPEQDVIIENRDDVFLGTPDED